MQKISLSQLRCINVVNKMVNIYTQGIPYAKVCTIVNEEKNLKIGQEHIKNHMHLDIEKEKTSK